MRLDELTRSENVEDVALAGPIMPSLNQLFDKVLSA
jgi:hypothetical protein